MRIMLGVILSLLVTVPCTAIEVLVDPSGGGDAVTIQAGIDLANSGDTVLVLPGTYYENLTMKSGVALIGSAGAAGTTIDMGGGLGINFEQCGTGTRIIGLKLTNGGAYCGGGVRLYDNSHVEIADCHITDNHTTFEAAGIHVHDNSYANIHDNIFDHNTTVHSVCISVIVGSNADIVDNLFMFNTSEHLSAGVGIHSSHAYLEGNVFYRNASNNGSALRSWNGSMEVYNNTFIFNSSRTEAADISSRSASMTHMERNLFAFPESGPAVLSDIGVNAYCNVFWNYETPVVGPDPIVGENGNVIVDPMLCDADVEKAAVSVYSPCLTGSCGIIGANPDPGCTDAIPTSHMSWGDLKRIY